MKKTLHRKTLLYIKASVLFLCVMNRVMWPGQLSADAYASFLRVAELGCSLSETWLVSNAATYLYNYSHHLLQAGSLRSLVPVFRPLLASVVAVRGHGTNERTMSVHFIHISALTTSYLFSNRHQNFMSSHFFV